MRGQRSGSGAILIFVTTVATAGLIAALQLTKTMTQQSALTGYRAVKDEGELLNRKAVQLTKILLNHGILVPAPGMGTGTTTLALANGYTDTSQAWVFSAPPLQDAYLTFTQCVVQAFSAAQIDALYNSNGTVPTLSGLGSCPKTATTRVTFTGVDTGLTKLQAIVAGNLQRVVASSYRSRQVANAAVFDISGLSVPPPSPTPTPTPTPPAVCTSPNTWAPMTGTGAPPAREIGSITWTGSEAAIWGGLTSFSSYTNTGGLYDPVANSWRPITTAGAPAARGYHGSGWVANRVVVWGGRPVVGLFGDGSRYDPVTNTWAVTSSLGVPNPRMNMASVSTGTQLLIWGGENQSGVNEPQGGIYDPAADTWTAMSTAGQPAPRWAPAAAWSGTEFLIWGGANLGSGGIYNPATNTWRPMTASPLAGREYMQYGWTGSALLIWGGYTYPSPVYSNGALFNPTTNTWTMMSSTGEPATYSYVLMAAIASGRFVTFGLGGGGRYDIATNAWLPMSMTGAPPQLGNNLAVSTGTHYITFGGSSYGVFYNTGGVYCP